MNREYYTIASRLDCNLDIESNPRACDKQATQILFLYTHSKDDVQRAVEEETALLGERRYKELRSGEIIPQLDDIIMDGEYDNLFRRYFDDARAELISIIPARALEDTPDTNTPVWLDGTDVRFERDLILWIWLKKDMPPSYRTTIDKLLLSFLVDYICYRWLDTKLPQDAAAYYSRLDQTKKRVIKSINFSGGQQVKRTPSFP